MNKEDYELQLERFKRLETLCVLSTFNSIAVVTQSSPQVGLVDRVLHGGDCQFDGSNLYDEIEAAVSDIITKHIERLKGEIKAMGGTV